MNGPLISIVMPAYNAASFIQGALLSVVNQRYWNWELIIVDDGSSDNTEHETKIFDDKRIRYLRLAKNRGLAEALNFGLTQAKGRFIARMDADDYMEDWRLSDQIKFLMLHGLAICGTGAEKFGIETGDIRGPKTAGDIINTFLVSNPFLHPTILLDREKIGRELRYDGGFRCEEDYELWARTVTPHNCGNIDYSTLKYRTSSHSNANHPQKKRLNRIVITRFAERMGILDVTPVDAISEFQIAGYIDAPGHAKLVTYAKLAETRNLPRLGWLQGPLLDHADFTGFFSWLNDVRQFSPYKY